MIDITLNCLPDYYLVFTGSKTGAISSAGTSCPWVIESVFLFNARELVDTLTNRNVKIGIATSVMNALWKAAEIYPKSNNKAYIITSQQAQMLSLFK